ncbi:MAG: radical SAM protein [Candidatus Aenigmatarchaeota archaeon]
MFEVIEEHTNYVVLRDLDGDLVLYAKPNNSIYDARDPRLKEILKEPLKLEFWVDKDFILRNLYGPWEKLVLEVTTSCDNRCIYCIYNGSYKGERTHSNEFMKRDVAEKALHLYLQHNPKTPQISFWGGEPLVNFGLISYVVSRSRDLGLNPYFGITTNMNLASKYAEFIIRNLVLTTSLDGPKEIHDRFRKPINGKSSYENVMHAIEAIRNLSPQYVDDIIFSVVLSDPTRIGDVKDFFENLFPKNRLKISEVYRAQDHNFETYSDKRKYMESMQKLAFEFVDSKNPSNFLRALFGTALLISSRKLDNLQNNRIFPMGLCLPSHTIFVDTKGYLHPCQETSSIEIGNVDDGLDISKIVSNTFEYISKKQTLLKLLGCKDLPCMLCVSKR